MLSTTMVTFRKEANCPSSQDLLAFQNEETSEKTGTLIKKHLERCEFCESEVEFYANYPQEAEEGGPSQAIPLPLYELAEALLSNKSRDLSVLEKLLGKNKGLELRKA